ncbi:MAG: 50S ribosomal protein L4 [archaeon YNP-WB-040]|nr:50S ribosomal protein L4 [Candidatus Culexarchaeum yellowstonense]
MHMKIYDLNGSVIGEMETPWFFQIPIRKDIIRRAYISSLTARIQPQGRDPLAGKRTTAKSWGVGHGVARVPRVKGSGYPEAGVAAFATMTVGGRSAHAPTVEKRIHEKINKKERIYAILSALSATANVTFVSGRGHLVSSIPQIPLIVSNELEKVEKSKSFRDIALKLGFWADIERVKEGIRIRAGKGKLRGRRYKIGKGPLIVVSNIYPLINSVKNFPGLNVVNARDLSVVHLAPGGNPGRLTIFTQSAIDILNERFSSYKGKHLLYTNIFNYEIKSQKVGG